MNVYGAMRRLAVAVIAIAGFVGCGGDTTRIILTTRLPAGAPPGENERVMYAMCTNMGKEKEDPSDALKVTFVKPNGEAESEKTL